MKSLFSLLEIPPTDDLAVVRRAYRKKILQYHPDRNPENESEHAERFRALKVAYEAFLVAQNPQTPHDKIEETTLSYKKKLKDLLKK